MEPMRITFSEADIFREFSEGNVGNFVVLRLNSYNELSKLMKDQKDMITHTIQHLANSNTFEVPYQRRASVILGVDPEDIDVTDIFSIPRVDL